VTDWSWGLAVHLWGVINGIKAFVPTLLAQGEPGHIIGTSSSNGAVVTMPSNPVYSMAKAAMVSVMESLYGQLAALDAPVRASVLVPPGVINTNLFTARRNRQPEYAPVVPREELPEVTAEETIRRMNERGNSRTLVEPDEVAQYVLEGLYEERFWILPKSRHGAIQEQFDTLIRTRADTVVGRGDPSTYLYK
jgi:NAD(P)-dependent dehydrogenase (short-subunit alcohol dehydrogenase family)